jgi:hypothetical protein
MDERKGGATVENRTREQADKVTKIVARSVMQDLKMSNVPDGIDVAVVVSSKMDREDGTSGLAIHVSSMPDRCVESVVALLYEASRKLSKVDRT